MARGVYFLAISTPSPSSTSSLPIPPSPPTPSRTLRDTDYVVTEKQYQKQQQHMLRAPANTSSLPSLPNPSKYGRSDDDMLSYLDNSSLTEEQIRMQLPQFEVGMTDKTIPVSEKRCVPKSCHVGDSTKANHHLLSAQLSFR